MPDKTGRMTPKEIAFRDLYTQTGDATYAAEKAGYGSPLVRGSQLLAKPAIMVAIRERETQRLWNDLLPLAIGEIERGLKDPTVPWGAKTNLTKQVLDRTLGASESLEAKAPSEMTPDELARSIAALKREASDRARPPQVIEGHVTTVEHEAPAQPEMGCLG